MTQLSGKAYLESLTQEYILYREFLRDMTQSAFDYQKQLIAKSETSVASFLGDFAVAFEERRRNLVRWKTMEKLPLASPQKISQILAVLPKFVTFNAEAAGGMSIKSVRRHKIDIVTEKIMHEISKRLPRKLDAYRYHQGYAQDTINIVGIGEINVRLSQNSGGIIYTISTISNNNFRIWNCRDTGVSYLDKYCDISNPSEIAITPLDLKLSIYSDGSGDEERSPRLFAESQDRAIIWLVDNLLNPLLASPLPEYQIDIPNMDLPFPENLVGPLFAFIEEENIEKTIILQQNGLDSAYPDERFAATPSLRLIPLGYNTKGLPEGVHDGFIWCGVGDIEEVIKSDRHQIANSSRNTWSMFSKEGVAEIKPLIATDVFIVDWQAWDDYRENAFKGGKEQLSNTEVGDMYRSVGSTFIPITQYQGNYKQPIILISRNLEITEIGKTYIFPDKNR